MPLTSPTPLPPSSPRHALPEEILKVLPQELPQWLKSPWAIALIASLGMHSLLLAWISQPSNQRGLNQQSAPVKVMELPASALGQLPATMLGGGIEPDPALSLPGSGTAPLVPLSPSVLSGLSPSALPPPSVLRPTPPAGLLSLQTLSLLPKLMPPPPPLGLEELPSRTVDKPPEKRPEKKTPPSPATSQNDGKTPPGEAESQTGESTPDEAEGSQTPEPSASQTSEPGADQTKPSEPATTAVAPRPPQLVYEPALTSAADVAHQREVFLGLARRKLDQPELDLPPARLQNLPASGPGCFARTAQPVEFMALVDGDGKPMIPPTLVQSSGYPDLNDEAQALLSKQSLPTPGQPYLLRVSLKLSPPKDCPIAAR